MGSRVSRSTAVCAAVVVGGGLVTAPAIAAHVTHRHGKRSSVAARVDATVEKMSLRDEIGQMFVTYVYGESATKTSAADRKENQQLYGVDNGAQLIAKYHLGGIIYFAWTNNLNSPDQVAGLSNGLQKAAAHAGQKIPLEISTDQEGGVVNRIGVPLAVSPGNMALGATFSPGLAKRVARANGQQLKAMGLNADYAPVVDTNSNPKNAADGPRAFGDNTTQVARFASAAVHGYHASGLASSAKHFPGLGSTTVNTDNGVAVTDESEQQIMRKDVPPFQAAISAHTDSVMAAHIVAPSLDSSKLPASMSKPIVTGLLRHKLGYNGVVYTDSLGAAALDKISPANRVLDAVNADDDQLLMPPNLGDGIKTLTNAVNSGKISRSRIDASVKRILRLKYAHHLFTHRYVPGGSHPRVRVGTPAQKKTMATAARESMTLVKNNGKTLPLSPKKAKKVLVTGYDATAVPALAADIGKHGSQPSTVVTGSNPSDSDITKAVSAAKSADATVVTTYNAWGDKGQQKLVNSLSKAGKPVVVVSLGGPYDIAYFDKAPVYLAAYDFQPESLDAAANTLYGTDPKGRLPVTVPTADNPKKALYKYGTGLHY